MNDYFVLGCGRSGTTMFASMLNNHPEIIMPPETWWLPIAYNMGLGSFPQDYLYRAFMQEVRSHFSGAGKEEWVAFTDAFTASHKGFRGHYNELFDHFAADAKAQFGALLFGEKTPAHTTFVRELESSFPAYKKIILLRDPRDIVCSYFKAWFGEDDKSLRTVLMTLKCYLLNIRHALDNYKCHQLKYESLTTSPAEEMERVCAYLEIPFPGRCWS